MDPLQVSTFEWLNGELDRWTKDNPDTTLADAVKAGNIDRKKYYKLYELAVAFDHGLHMWEKIPPTSFDALNIQYYVRCTINGEPSDKGVDCASLDLKTVAQAKWYAKQSSQITWTAMSTFHSLACVCESQNLLVVSPPGVRIHSLAEKLPLQRHTLSDERFLEICDAARAWRTTSTDTSSDGTDTLPPLDDFLDEILGDAPIQKLRPALPTQEDPPFRFCQEQAIELASESFESRGTDWIHDTIAIAMPCGTGKSRVIAEMIRRDHSGSPHLVFVPSKLLLYQMEDSLRRWTPELRVGLIGDGHVYEPGADAYVCIYNSAEKLAEYDWGLIVVDEAHHVFEELTDAEYLDDDAREYASVIRDLSYERTLLMSATIPDSDDFPLAYSYSIEEAIRDGILCDYQVVIPIFTEGTPTNGLAGMLTTHQEWRRVLAYCNSLEAAKQFAELLNAAGVAADWFGGKTPMTQRQQKIEQLRSGALRVLVTVHTLGEGVDIPEADCCMFVEPRGSPVDVTQCVGRVLRVSPGKTIANVVLPSSNEERDLVKFLSLLGQSDSRLQLRAGEGNNRVVVEYQDAQENTQEEAKLLCESTYSRTGALMSGGEWMVKYELLKQYVEENGCIPKQKERYQGISIGHWCDGNRSKYKAGSLSGDRFNYLNAISGWSWEKNNDAWTTNYSMLLQYIEQFNKMPAPKESFAGVNLGSWCCHNRRNYKKGKLSQDRIVRLESIPRWFWEKDLDELWSTNYASLQQYVVKFNKMPTVTATFGGVYLGSWCVHNRKNYKKGTLSQERIDRLEAVPGWSWEKHDDAWSANYAFLQQYVAEFNKTPTYKESFGEIKLGVWCHYNRQAYKKGTLSQDRIDRLEAILGWFWEKDLDGAWTANYALLQQYVSEFGNIPAWKDSFGGVRLGTWCNTNRRNYIKGTLSQERIDKLEAVPGWIWDMDGAWMVNYVLLQQYVAEFNKTPAQKESFSGIKLGLWCSHNRQAYKKGTLSQERIERLETIPGWFWEKDLDGAWMANYVLMQQYIAEFNKLPAQMESYGGVRIGLWCGTNRQGYKKGTLSQDRIDKLESIPGWWWTKK